MVKPKPFSSLRSTDLDGVGVAFGPLDAGLAGFLEMSRMGLALSVSTICAAPMMLSPADVVGVVLSGLDAEPPGW